MTWAAIIKGLLDFFNGLFAFLSASRAEELGRLKEAERNAQGDQAVRDAVLRADPDGVPDEQAFGVGGRDNDLPRSKP